MLNQYAVDIPTLPVNLCFPTSSNSWWNAEPFCRIAEPQRRAAKHLGHAWYIGKRFCRSNCILFSTLSAGIESMEYRRAASFIQWKRVRIKHQSKIRDASPSAKSSVVPSERDSLENHGADKQRLQISDLHLDKLPSPATFACWNIRFKTEVCTCSQFLTEALHWVKEVRWLIQWIRVIQMPNF